MHIATSAIIWRIAIGEAETYAYGSVISLQSAALSYDGLLVRPSSYALSTIRYPSFSQTDTFNSVVPNS